ncbi:hypothetical protein E2C01_006557 [Portunus trituberculatus]|uniref:Uncharacterized protein n=1 Tax=Portunus trituberculatus TaxID=210409 RepID=A0A5B7CY68_PORTR|nr:hypothetical protein [Portunus trituberculatus]
MIQWRLNTRTSKYSELFNIRTQKFDLILENISYS